MTIPIDGRVRASTVISGLKTLIEKLSDFEPEMQGAVIDYGDKKADLHFTVRVPDGFLDRKKSSIVIPEDFKFKSLRGQGIKITDNEVSWRPTEWHIPAKELSEGDDYTLILESRLSKDDLDPVVMDKSSTGRISRNKFEHNLVVSYLPIYKNDEPIWVRIHDVRVQRTYDERYIISDLREQLDSLFESESGFSDNWQTQYDEDKNNRIIQEIAAESNHDQIDITSLLDLLERRFSEEIISDFIEVDEPFKFHGIFISKGELIIPRNFVVTTRVEIHEDRQIAEGVLTFNRSSFWTETEQEVRQKK